MKIVHNTHELTCKTGGMSMYDTNISMWWNIQKFKYKPMKYFPLFQLTFLSQEQSVY
jgi:hypothetical protein